MIDGMTDGAAGDPRHVPRPSEDQATRRLPSIFDGPESPYEKLRVLGLPNLELTALAKMEQARRGSPSEIAGATPLRSCPGASADDPHGLPVWRDYCPRCYWRSSDV